MLKPLPLLAIEDQSPMADQNEFRPVTPCLKHYEARSDQTGMVDLVSIVIDSNRGEVSIDIQPRQPLPGDKRPEDSVREELEHLRGAIHHILSTPGAISRLVPGPTE
jgi:hypothetical protein